MSGLDPSGPSQPTIEQGYEASGNPATKEPAEESKAQANAADNSGAVDQRIPSEQSSSVDEATGSSLGRGVHGAGPGEEQYGTTHEEAGRNQELDAQQMAAPGEGDVRDAVVGENGRQGATGGQEGLESDLDRKKREQAPAREAIKEQRQKEVDIGGILGQRGGPANPVDKGNYPNSGD